MRRLSEIIANIKILERHGVSDPGITGIEYDSRRVKPGNLFFALEGIHTNGHEYIDGAIEKGADVIIHSKPLKAYRKDVVYLLVENTRRSLSPAAGNFYDNPSEKLVIVGVTGTDGKSTTVSLIHQLLELSGEKAGFLSTVEYKSGMEILKNPYRQSTPEAPEINKILNEMYLSGKKYGVIEATSHGLSRITNRLGDIIFDAGVFTNVTREHLEFHGTIDRYRSDKVNLFRSLDNSFKKENLNCSRFGVINKDDPWADLFEKATGREVFSYSMKSKSADLFALVKSLDICGSEFTLIDKSGKYNTKLNIPGAFNIENTMAAILVVSILLNKKLKELAELLPELRPIRGRMNHVKMGQAFSVIVDYAHTPGAFSKLFPIIKKQTKGKLISVFGSGGERDIGKRPIQGRIAANFCNTIILTDEDPRGEDPRAILEDIAAGCSCKEEGENLFLIPDRVEAIRKAFSLAGKEDTVILLGKGHESSIIYSNACIPWDETAAAENCLIDMGFKGC